MKQIIPKTALIMLLTLISFSTIWSGTSGKITGYIVDKETGEPLAGANIVVQSTSLGASVDLNGRFTILEVPPGTYTVQISYVGYRTIIMNDVRVLIDQTTRLDTEMEPESLELDAIVVVAQRDLLKPDVGTSTISINPEEIETLPVSDIVGILNMQAGIQYLNVRGGSDRDLLFMIDGITARDPRNNQPISKVALSSIQEVSVERGGFNAEYGQVQSGLVNVVTKEGKKQGYSGSFLFKYTPPQAKYFRTNGTPDVNDVDSYWLRPYYDPDVCWTGTKSGAWDDYMQKQYPFFVGWNEVSKSLLMDNDPDNDLTPMAAQRVFMYETRKAQPNDEPDYEMDAGFGGPVPFISEPLGNLRFFTSYRSDREMLLWPEAYPDYRDYDWSLTMNSEISKSMKLRFNSLIGKQYTLAENWNYGYYPRWPSDIAGGTGGYPLFNLFSDWAYSKAEISHQIYGTKFTHTISANTFYEISVDYFRREYDTFPTALRDTSTKTEILPGYFVDEYPIGYWPYEQVGVTPEIADGVQASLARDNSLAQSFTFKTDLTSQLNYANLIKAGIEFVYNDLDLDYGFIQMLTKGQTYGQHVQMQNYPIRAAAYIQDKLETNGFTLNGGLRLDYSDSRTDWWDIDPYDPLFISQRYNDSRDFPMKKSKSQWQISPRLAISHPITENSKLFFNYGHFKQMPQYESLFRVRRNSQGVLQTLGDPNLELSKTVSYELGYDHILYNYTIQLAAFYRDITNEQTTVSYFPKDGDPTQYQLTTSNQYRDIRGFELTVRKGFGHWLTGFANYTYQVSSSGHFGRSEIYEDAGDQKNYYDNDPNKIYQQRPVASPYARVNLTFTTPDDYGPPIFDQHIFGGFMTNILFSWSQGGYTTYNPNNISGIENNVQYLDSYDGTLRMAKTFTFDNFSVQFLMDIGNLFNQMRLRDSGNREYRESLHLPKNEGYSNIPGNDKFGDYRKPGVDWQPMKYRQVIEGTTPPLDDIPIYYEGDTGRYFEIVDNQWQEVDAKRINKILDDKAYIYHADASTWRFLGPRTYTFGLRLSFNLN
jgi:outer membrane receptor protein involved in Fe transport